MGENLKSENKKIQKKQGKVFRISYAIANTGFANYKHQKR